MLRCLITCKKKKKYVMTPPDQLIPIVTFNMFIYLGYNSTETGNWNGFNSWMNLSQPTWGRIKCHRPILQLNQFPIIFRICNDWIQIDRRLLKSNLTLRFWNVQIDLKHFVSVCSSYNLNVYFTNVATNLQRRLKHHLYLKYICCNVSKSHDKTTPC